MSSEDYIEFAARCKRLDARFGLKSIVSLHLKRTTANIICHRGGQQTLIHEEHTTSLLTFDLPINSPEYIHSILLQQGVEHQICNFIAPKISHTAERFGHGRQGLQIDVNVGITKARFYDIEELAEGNESQSRGGLSEEAMKMLKRETRFNGGDLKRDGDCSICLEGLSGARKLIQMPCSHLFHESCIFTWLQTKNSCPLCRKVPFADGSDVR